MEDFAVISGLISIVLIVIFIIMAINLAVIKREVLSINKIFVDWSKANGGYGFSYICSKCKKSFDRQPDKCPHCGELTSWGKIKVENNK